MTAPHVKEAVAAARAARAEFGLGLEGPVHDLLVVVINANKNAQTYASSAFVGKALRLHPLQAISLDAAVRSATFTSESGSFSVPGRTAAVFWANRPATEQIGLLIQDVDTLVTAGKLTSGRGTALKAKLQAAQQQAQAGHATPASSQLLAFISQVQSTGLPPADADALATNACQAIGQLFL